MKLLVALGLLASLLLGADLVVANVAEDRAESRVSEALGAPAEVDLHGWPVGLKLLLGRVSRAEVTARDVPLDDVPADVERLDVTLRGVRAGLDDVRSSDAGVPPADSGTFEARLGENATFALASVPSSVANLSISDGAVRLQILGVEAEGDVIVRRGNVVIVPRTPLGALVATEVPLDISDQPGQPRIEEAEIDGDVLILRGVLQAVSRDGGDG